MELECRVGEEDNGKSVKHILKCRMDISERLLKKLKSSGGITLNSTPVHVNAAVSTGDIVLANISFDEGNDGVIPEDIPIEIIHEDKYIIAVNKQPGIVVHPTSSHPSGTVANAVLHHILKNGGTPKKIRPVSRLDRDTTGVILFAKNQYVQEFLVRQMHTGTFRKEYLGIVEGIMDVKSGTIDLPIDRKPGSIMLRHVADSGSRAVTHFEVAEYLSNATLLKFVLETGRTHQIRVHCQAVGHPLFGDTLYSDIPTSLINRQALHSFKTVFVHPDSKETIELNAPLPSDMVKVLEILRI